MYFSAFYRGRQVLRHLDNINSVMTLFTLKERVGHGLNFLIRATFISLTIKRQRDNLNDVINVWKVARTALIQSEIRKIYRGQFVQNLIYNTLRVSSGFSLKEFTFRLLLPQNWYRWKAHEKLHCIVGFWEQSHATARVYSTKTYISGPQGIVHRNRESWPSWSISKNYVVKNVIIWFLIVLWKKTRKKKITALDS